MQHGCLRLMCGCSAVGTRSRCTPECPGRNYSAKCFDVCRGAALQLAARIAVSNLHKSTLKSFTET
jgi:hypothetical protein